MSTVTEYLQDDHARIDALLENVQELASEGAFSEAQQHFAGFVSGLARHIEVEENLLFPTFETLTGMTMGPTVVMRREHEELRRLWESVEETLAHGDADTFKDAIASLLGLLGAHNQKEERMLYPMTDRALGSDEARGSLVGKLRQRLGDAPAKASGT